MRKTRVALVAALAAGAVSLIGGAGSASGAACAYPFTCVPLSFNNAVLDVPGARNSVVISPSTTPLTTTATISTPPSGSVQAFTIDPADFHFPTFNFTTPVSGSITAHLNGPASGTFDASNGKVDLTADIVADITVLGNPCSVDAGPLAFSTDNPGPPLPGTRFPPGAAGVVTGAGAFVASWSTLPDGTGSGCPIVNGLTKGPGGLWISRNITPNFGGGGGGTATLALKLDPKKQTVTAGKKAKIKAEVSNTGTAEATNVSVCVKVKKPLKATKKCQDYGTLAAGAKASKKFKIKTSKKDPGKFKAKFTASGTGTGLSDVSAKAKIKAVAKK
jgi:NPCBM-associated, NEW3 domain of alpha-galactosidase